MSCQASPETTTTTTRPPGGCRSRASRRRVVQYAGICRNLFSTVSGGLQARALHFSDICPRSHFNSMVHRALTDNFVRKLPTHRLALVKRGMQNMSAHGTNTSSCKATASLTQNNGSRTRGRVSNSGLDLEEPATN